MFRPVFTATVPDGWHIRSGLDYSDPAGDVRVSVFEEPVPPEFTTQRYAAAYGELLHQHFPGYRELGNCAAEVTLGGLSCATRRLRWQPAQGRPLVQTQAYLVLGQRGVVATAVAAEADFADRHDELDAALNHASIGPLRLTPRSPAAATARRDAPGRFDAGELLLVPAEAVTGQEPDVVCTIDELAAFARGLGLAAFPGVPDSSDGTGDSELEHRLTAARRSLRARGLVELLDSSAQVSAAGSVLSWLVDAGFMLTLESTGSAGSAKYVWYGSAGRYVQVLALDDALVRIGWTAKDAILSWIEADVRAGADPPRSGRVAWLGRAGHRYEGAALAWQRTSDGSIVEVGPDSAAAPVDASVFVNRIADAITWPEQDRRG